MGCHLLLQGIVLTHLSLQGREEAKSSPDPLMVGFTLGWSKWCSGEEKLLGQVQVHRSLERGLVGCGVLSIPPVATWKEGAHHSGALWALAKDKPIPRLRAKKKKNVAFEKVCPLPLGGTFAVKSVHGIFIPLIRPRQDLVHKFSRGNAFNKNLMGSGSSAESPYEFQVFLWSLVWAGAQLQSANGLL